MFRILVDPVSTALYPMPFNHIDAFAFGAYISRYPIAKAKEQFWLLLGCMPAIGFAAQYIYTGNTGNISALGFPLLMPAAYQFIWGYSLLGYFFMLIIFLVVDHGMFTRLLDTAPMRYLGKISYGLYVYHFPIIWFSGRIRDLGLSEMAAKPLTAIIAFAATFGIASLSYHFMEKPLLDLKDRFFSLKPDRT
jgi:peptidoglycan/LPS O-acetylase OafA/YrhL